MENSVKYRKKDRDNGKKSFPQAVDNYVENRDEKEHSSENRRKAWMKNWNTKI